MLTRPISCGVTATIEAMASVELVPRFSPFDVLSDEDLKRPVMLTPPAEQQLASDCEAEQDLAAEFCELIEQLSADLASAEMANRRSTDCAKIN